MKLILEVDLSNEKMSAAEDTISAAQTLIRALFESAPANADLTASFENALEKQKKSELVLAEMAEPFIGEPEEAPDVPTIVARIKVTDEVFKPDQYNEVPAVRKEFRNGLGDIIPSPSISVAL